MSEEKQIIYCVDPDKFILMVLEVNLRYERFEVFTFEDPGALWDRLVQVNENQRPKVIITEVGGDYWELIERVRHDPRFSEIWIVVLSMHKDDYYYERATTIGVDFYFTKPFEPSEIVLPVQTILENKET